MPQEVSSLPPVQKVALFSITLCSPSNVHFFILPLSAWPLFFYRYWSGTCLCLCSLCSWVAIWIFERIHPSIFYKSSLCLFVLYHPALSPLWLLVRSAFPQLWRCFVKALFVVNNLFFKWWCGCRRSCLLLLDYQDAVVCSWSLAKLPEVLAKVYRPCKLTGRVQV